MMTEQEATGRWCPFGRLGWFLETTENGVGGITFNRTHEGDGDPNSLCLGSSCMAWRWATTSSRRSPYPGGHPVNETKRERGYCGLAGRP